MANLTEEELEAHETERLIASDKVEGTAVYNHDGDRLGSIEKVMIDKVSGRVSYAVMSFGGFLGIGDRRHPLPWEVLTYDTELDGYVVGLDKEQLRDAPSYAREDEPRWDDRAWGQGVFDHYRVPR